MKNNNSSSIADILLVVSKHLGLIILCAIVGVIFTVVYLNKIHEPEFTSTSTVFVPADEYGSGRSDLGVLASQFGITSSKSAGTDISSATLYPDIVNSNMFAQIMFDKEFYSEKYNKKLPLIAIFTYGDNPVPTNIDTLKIAAAKRISRMVDFSMAAGFFIIDVTSNEAQFSRDFADTMLVELDKLQRKFRKRTVNEKIQYLNKKIVIAEEELRVYEEDLKKFRETNRNVDNSPSLLLKLERLERNVNVQQGIFITLKQQLELAKIEEVQKSSFVQILDYPSLPLRISNPIRKAFFYIGGIMGLFLGFAFAFVIEYYKGSNPDEKSKIEKAKNNLLKPFTSFIKIFSKN